MLLVKRHEKGFSAFEIVIVVAVIAMIAAIGMVAADRAIEGSRSAKLVADVETINSAVRGYLSQGGDFDIGESTDPNLVIARLKGKLSAEDAETFVGFKGSMVDPRLRAVILTEDEEGTAMQRAVWLPAESRFSLATTGGGIKKFVLDATPVVEERSRESALKYSETSNWVWDYADHPPIPKPQFDEPDMSPTATPATPGSAASQGALLPPSMSIPSGTYDYSHFPLSVALSNPNSSGQSRILYQVNGGSWNVHSGPSVFIAPSAMETLVAYCESANPDLWLDSIPTTETYSTFTFSGRTSGEFVEAEGSSEMVAGYEMVDEQARFYWGDPAVANGYVRPSELMFTGAEFSTIILEEEFVLGTLDYFNGTIWAGTGADNVDLEVSLSLSVDVALPTTGIAFELQLVNTPNDWDNNTDDENADFVRLSVPVQELTTTIGGVTYYVHLSFGESGPESFTTDSTFHVWEGSDASGTILAKFSTTPPGDEDVTRPSALMSARSTLVGGAFNIDITFSEYVTDLALSDFSISNGTASALNGDGFHFVLGVAPSVDGAVTVALGENAAFDLAGNGNTASNSAIVSVDKTAPTLNLIAAPAANGDFVVDAKFSEPVVGLSTFDWETRNGVVTSVVGTGVDYRATVIPGSIGWVTIGLKSGAVTDLVGHSVQATATINVQFDPVAPEATLSLNTSDPNPTVSGMFAVDVVLTDAVADLAPTDFVVSNGLAYTIVEIDSAHYSISIVPQHPGAVSLYLAEGSVHDLAGNGNAVSNTVVAQYDPLGSASGYLDFNDYTIESWGSILFFPQDEGIAEIKGGGKELRLSEDAWKSINFAYDVTANTVLEFEFAGTNEGEVYGIGFDNDVFLSIERIFQLFGTQERGIQDFHDYSGSQWQKVHDSRWSVLHRTV